MELIHYFLIYIAVVNLIGFCIMGYDKYLAIKGRYRISEYTLFMTAFLGGALGSYLGMFKFRHKTKHASFLILMPILIIINIFCIYYIISNFII